MKRISILLLIMVTLVLLAACGGQAEQSGGESAPAGKQKFVYVSPNPLGVNDFLIMGKTGLEEAGKKYNAETKVLESDDPTTREENVRAAISDGATLVIVLGFEFGDIIPKVAGANPNVQFLIVDQCIDNPPANVHCAVFKEYEAAFLLGAVAANLTKTGTVGAISAMDIPFLHRYTDGFAQGAKYVKPDIKTSTLWIGSDPTTAFSDPARAKEQALAMAADGADQIFAAGAASNLGIFEAAKEKNFFTYGVDVNQCPLAEGHVVENLIKRVDTAIIQSVDKIMSGAKENFLAYGLAEKGIGLVALTTDKPEDSKCEIMKSPDVIKKAQEIQQKIISGEIKIEDPMFVKK
ncbi:MAG: BMP family ABC transporter substrate-binding protein [Anaerolineae bacterium]